MENSKKHNYTQSALKEDGLSHFSVSQQLWTESIVDLDGGNKSLCSFKLE